MRDSAIGLVLLVVVTGLVLAIVAIFNAAAPNAYIYQLQGPVTGVHVTHSGADVMNLFVSIGPPGGDTACGGIVPCGDTDGTGVWTFHAALWHTSDPVYYFTYGGEGYAFHGSVGQITEVRV